jgi:hypothetical protein
MPESDEENVRPDSSRGWLHCEVIANILKTPFITCLCLCSVGLNLVGQRINNTSFLFTALLTLELHEAQASQREQDQKPQPIQSLPTPP